MDKQSIINSVNVYWDKSKQIYPALADKPVPVVGFYDKGVTAGRAYRKHRVEFNVTLAKENGDRFDDTISHEVAHSVQFILFPNSQPHGREWKTIHRRLGGSGSTYHSYNVMNVKRHRKGSQVFRCDCEGKLFTLTPQKSLHALVGVLTCKACSVKLIHVGSVDKLKGAVA